MWTLKSNYDFHKCEYKAKYAIKMVQKGNIYTHYM